MYNFTFSDPCIAIHVRAQDQQDAHFFLIICFNYIILDMFRTNVHHQEVSTAAYSILPRIF